MQFANEKAALLANEEAQKMQMTTHLNQLQEECDRLTNQLQEDNRQQDSLHKRLQDTESCIVNYSLFFLFILITPFIFIYFYWLLVNV